MSNSNINKNLDNLKNETLHWSAIQSQMKEKLGSEVYESWLKKISFIEEFNNYILLTVPTRFIRDWITSRYLDQILQIVKTYKKEIIRIEFKIADQISNKETETKKEIQKFDNKENISFIKTPIFNIIELILTKDLIILLLDQAISLHTKHL